jgi:ArsR family transcriptional regulator, arsenate/arsenite/antimonite-responsive transcriptional repressor
MNSKLEARAEFFKALGHPSRLLIMGLCRQKPRHTEELAALLQITSGTTSHHLTLLEKAGLLRAEREQYYQNYSAISGILSTTLEQIIETGFENFTTSSDPFKEKVLRDFFKHGRLKSIPAQCKKRVIILEKIAESFDLDRNYHETEVNALIQEFYEDYATLRRAMINDELLKRHGSIYRRNNNPQPLS